MAENLLYLGNIMTNDRKRMNPGPCSGHLPYSDINRWDPDPEMTLTLAKNIEE